MKQKRFAVTTAAVIGVMAGLSGATFSAHAQQAPIERIKLTDNELSCAQLHAEAADMDKLAAEAKAAEGQGNSTALAGSAGSVAAEVAVRTGLFGSLGGLAGNLFGQVAAKTAAGVAQQSGQMTAQQAAERSRQAGARKEQVSTLFLNKGCKTSDLAYNPPAPPRTSAVDGAKGGPVQLAAAAANTAGQAAHAPAKAILNLPNLDPDIYFTGKTGGTFGKSLVEVLPGSKRVAVTGFRVVFITSNTASAQVRGSYLPGRDTSGASSTLIVTLSGVDTATMQAITDRAYADFLAQLRLAGRELVPQEELKEFLAGVDTPQATAGKPYTKEINAQTGMVFAPTGMPLWFHQWDAGWSDSMFSQKNYRSAAEYSHKLNAITIAPLIVLNFANMSSSGNQSGFTSRSAETGATLAMSVNAFTTSMMRSEETRGGLVTKGDEGMALLSGRFISELQFGAFKDAVVTDNSGVKGIADALGNAMGLANAGGAARGKKESIAETSNAAYAAAAGDALARATGTFAKWFQKYPAR
ncbi:MAG: hypothetical protein EXR27_02510 [Betaproteobacteria bacterium]|nr:hypothetical protein [Betaproteobacteria bacterium]